MKLLILFALVCAQKVYWPDSLWPTANQILNAYQMENFGQTFQCKLSWRMRLGDVEIECPYQPPTALEAKQILSKHPEFVIRAQKHNRYNSISLELREMIIALWKNKSWEQIVDEMP